MNGEGLLVREPSAWLRAAEADAAVAVGRGERAVVVLPNRGGAAVALFDMASSPDPVREDRTCDRCRVFQPKGETCFHALFYRPRRGILLYGGLCHECARLENNGVEVPDEPRPAGVVT
jgi:hypothetical protein